MHVVTRGLVLREVNYKETDKILTVLAEGQGKRTVKARGCRRKNSPLAAPCLLYTSLERGFRTLDFYKSLQISP